MMEHMVLFKNMRGFMFVNLLKLFGMSDSFPNILGTTLKVVAKSRFSPHLKKTEG